MKAIKKTATLLLTAFLVISMMTACGNTQAAVPTDTAGGAAPATQTGNAPQGQSVPQEEYTVKIVFVGDSTTEACNKVAEAASKITTEKFNTKIELLRIGYGSFLQEVNLMLSSGEKLDLMPNFAYNTATAANNGQILPLDNLLKENGKDMLEKISEEDWRCVTIDGQIYAVPNNKEKAQGFGIAMLTEILDKINYDVSKLKTDADVEQLFRAVKEAYPDIYPLVSDNGGIGYMMAARDELGGDFGLLENPLTGDTKVVNWYETETYKNIIRTRYKWAQEGLIMPDASTNTENAGSLIGSGKGFAYYTNTKPGIDAEWARKVGKDMTVVELVSPFTTTSGVSNQWYIAHNSEKPERAMQVLNEMYINPDMANLLVNGIEGEHYVVDKANGVIDYPAGVDASNTTYTSVAWAWLNELITTPWKADGPNIWKDTIKFNETATPSVAKGFMWNNSNVLNEITACNNATAKYTTALECGSLDPETTIPKLNQELKEAGIERIIAEKQAQLDKWLETKK